MAAETGTGDRASQYFAGLNEISKKIALDIEDIRGAYEHIWDDLSREEQMEIVNETIIKPELTLKYYDSFSTSSDSFRQILGGAGTGDEDNSGDDRKVNLYDGRTLQSFQLVRTGRKLVNDETVGLYRDEHSAPFAHKTKSQMNLTIFPADQPDGGGRPTAATGTSALALSRKLLVKSPRAADIGAPAKHPDATIRTLYDQENNLLPDDDGKVPGTKLLAKFNNLIFNQSAGMALTAASIDGSDEHDDQSLEHDPDEFDTDDKANLFTKSSKNECLHRVQSSSTEEDDKNYDELNSLLGSSKGFDFLNNW